MTDTTFNLLFAAVFMGGPIAIMGTIFWTMASTMLATDVREAD